MKSKQLANVLIKVLGLSLCPQSVMHFFTGMANVLANSRGQFFWVNFVSGGLLAAMGIYFITRSQIVAGYLCRGEDE